MTLSTRDQFREAMFEPDVRFFAGITKVIVLNRLVGDSSKLKDT